MDSLGLFAGSPSRSSHAEFSKLSPGVPAAPMGSRKPEAGSRCQIQVNYETQIIAAVHARII